MFPDLIVVTDLDGTLLDHFTYSFDAAKPALKRLRALHVPLILNSSKTVAEMLEIRKELNNHEPFIVENGAGIMFPTDHGLKEYSLGMNRAEILAVIHALREKSAYRFSGFADMSAAQISEHTGLPEQRASLAMQRRFTEPLLWNDSSERLESFRQALQDAGLSLVRGGRFWHVSGVADKGRALNELRRYYHDENGTTPKVIALGDSENDVPMLQAADFAVLVRSPVKELPALQHEHLTITEACGPEGWNQALDHLLESLEKKQN